MRSLRLLGVAILGLAGTTAWAAHTNNIMLTGFWPPTNEMIRSFSNNPEQNPNGWTGGNWEGSGYNVYSYFPEFPGGTGTNPKGNGDFEVDYQDTSADFWRITADINPVAIISFGLADNDYDWEVEGGNLQWEASRWDADYLIPRRPTPELPIYNEPAGTGRYSSLPRQAIVDAVDAALPQLNPYSPNFDMSKFLCNFMGYHVNWYHALHSDPSDPAWNVSSGFIHVGGAMSLADATTATEVTLRTVIDYVDTIVPEPSAAMLLWAAVLFVRRR